MELPKDIVNSIKDLMPDLLALGLEEHFMTDYGDESSYELPWELYDENSANQALGAARRCYAKAVMIVQMIHESRSKGT